MPLNFRGFILKTYTYICPFPLVATAAEISEIAVKLSEIKEYEGFQFDIDGVYGVRDETPEEKYVREKKARLLAIFNAKQEQKRIEEALNLYPGAEFKMEKALDSDAGLITRLQIPEGREALAHSMTEPFGGILSRATK